MRLALLPLLAMALANVGVDLYVYKALTSRFHRRFVKCIALALAAIGWVLLAIALMTPTGSGSEASFLSLMWVLMAFFSVYVPKYIFLIFDLLAKIPCLFRRKRLRLVSIVGAVLGLAAFLMIWWGALINRYRIDVEKVDVEIVGLPKDFDGFTIAHFSDLHVGSFGNDTAFVAKFVDKINSLRPDMIVFTGDIVNRRSDELRPFVAPLSRLKAPYGAYAVLGNHDYGDYYQWKSKNEKDESRKLLARLYESTAMKLLRDSTCVVRRGSDSIAVIGVENIGRPPFTAYGSLADAYPSVGDGVVKILLSHDPSHWADSIADRDDVDVALTLSGHTHAMQFKFGRFSPASLHHDLWAGLYKDKSGDHQLYVNIGSGEVGPPMRIGATPEITLFTLKCR